MKVVHVPKKNRINHGYFLIVTVLITIGSLSELHSTIDARHKEPSVAQEHNTQAAHKPIAVFPLQNATGTTELDWLSIALQENLTLDLYAISDLYTRTLLDLTALIKQQCPEMSLPCIAGPTPESLTLNDWQGIATDAQLGQFLWGNYQLDGEVLEVHLTCYAGEEWHAHYEVIIRAPLAELLQKSSQQFLSLLNSRGIFIKPEERERILSTKTASVTAWHYNALGYWWQQRYMAAEENTKMKAAETVHAYFNKAVVADPDYAEAWCNLGFQNVLTGNLDDAIKGFRRALERKPGMANAHMGLGYCLAEKHDLTDAIFHLEKGIRLKPSLSNYHVYLMHTYQAARLWEEGLSMTRFLEAFLDEHERENERMEIVWWQALFLQELKQLEASQAAYREVLAFKEKTLGPEHPDVATILNNLAFLNKSLGEYSRAEKLFERALAIDEHAYGPEDPQVALRLSNLALLYHARGEYDRAQPLYERALSIDEQAYGSDHLTTARDLNNLGKLHYDRGHYEKAQLLYERTLTIYEKLQTLEQPEAAAVFNNLALLYHTRGEYDRAQSLYERALSIDEQAYGQQHPAAAKDVSNLAGLYYDRGRYDQAQSLYERALTIDQAVYGNQHPEVAKDLSNLAGVYYTMGEYAQAKIFYERALAIDETTYGNQHPAVAKDLNNLAQLYKALGNYEKAESLYQQALDINEKIYDQNHSSVATVLNNLAELHAHLGNYTKATPLYERALTIYKKNYGEKHPHVATVLNNLAGINYASGNYTKAKALYEEALTIDQNHYGDEHPRVAIRLNNLGELYSIMGDYKQARNLYERALLVAQTSGQPELLWRIQFNFGYLLAQQKNPYAAIFFGKQAVNTIQSVRTAMSDIGKDLQQSFLKTKWHVYIFLADLLIDYGRLPEAQQVLDMQKEEEYFDFLCRSVNRDDMLTTKATYTEGELNSSERYREINDRIAAFGKEFAELKKKKKFGITDRELKRYQQLTDDLKVAREAFNNYLTALIDALSSASRERYAEVKAKRLDKPRKLQQALQELGHGAVVIHYLIIEDKLRIILTTTEIQLARDIEISSKELNHKIMAFRKTVQNPRQSPLDQSQELYKIIIGPIDQDLRQSGAQTLMLSLDGVLRYLPITALHDGEGYLVERYQVAMYTAAAGMDIKDTPSERWMVGGFGLSHAIRNLDPLPNVPFELEGIVRRDVSDLDGVLPGVIYLDEAFSRETVESVLAEEFPVLHIASHFELKPGTKDDSHLVLGDGNKLTLAEIKESDYDFGDVEMLTLSACNTAVGATGANGSELESFGTLAQDQGAKGVLATLWPVSDRSTGILMQNFYRLHQDQPGMTKAEALRHAQLLFITGESAAGTLEDTTRGMRVTEVRSETAGEELFASDDKNPYTHPFYWAPFILMGNWL